MEPWTDDSTTETLPSPALQRIRTRDVIDMLVTFQHERTPLRAKILGFTPALLRQELRRREWEIAADDLRLGSFTMAELHDAQAHWRRQAEAAEQTNDLDGRDLAEDREQMVVDEIERRKFDQRAGR